MEERTQVGSGTPHIQPFTRGLWFRVVPVVLQLDFNKCCHG